MYKKYGAWQNGGNGTELYNKHKTSVRARHDLLLFKVTHCLHWSKHMIDQVFGNTESVCVITMG